MIPAYSISAGGITAASDSLTKSGLPVSLRVDLRMKQINTAIIRLGPVPEGNVAVGDEVEIELGDDEGGTAKVFTGVVSELRRQAGGYTIWCSSALQCLTRLHVNKVYEQQKAGDIVSDLAGIAELSSGSVEAGLSYPFYAIGSDRHLLDHLLTLAKRDGFDLYADVDDALVYAAYSGPLGLPLKLRYGAEILEFHAEEQAAAVDGVEVYGESPASLGEGDKAYSWLTKEEVKGNAGSSSGNVLRMAIASIRNQDAAGIAAENILAELSLKNSGWVEVLGTSKPELGGTIELSDIPDGGPNGSYKVTGVKHRLDKTHGFITTVFWREV
jgi:hypothetical protein